jgi:hypothetical protein
MRARLLAILALLLLSMAGFAVADEPDEDEDGSDSSGEDGGSGDDGSGSSDGECTAGNSTSNSTSDDECDDDRPQRCSGDGRPGNQSDSCRVAESARDGLAGGWVDFDVLEGAGLANYTVSGRLVLERLEWIQHGELDLERKYQRMRVSDGNGTLTLHDNPTGLIHFRGTGEFDLTFPEGITATAGENFTVVTSNGTDIRVLFDNGSWDGPVLSIDGFWSLHVPVRAAASEFRHEMKEELSSGLEDAIQERRIGAEVRLQRVEDETAVAAADATDSGVEILAYDAVDVEVEMPVDLATNETPIRVQVSSELSEGRVIVLNVDPNLLQSADPGDLIVKYFDVNDDGSETQVVFRMAADFNDALDATDDGGQPEYWMVSDANGLQLLVTVPYWSTHAITLASVADVVVQPSVIVGVLSGVAGSVAAAAIMVWPRRRHEI